jgi:hypothetical protein
LDTKITEGTALMTMVETRAVCGEVDTHLEVHVAWSILTEPYTGYERDWPGTPFRSLTMEPYDT